YTPLRKLLGWLCIRTAPPGAATLTHRPVISQGGFPNVEEREELLHAQPNLANERLERRDAV
ncbi:MAG: hypothetical protein ACJ79Y_14120, partial [Myxococcales bacterium]